MSRKKFLSTVDSFDVYDSLFKHGLIVAPKQYNKKYLYIIGIDISYDTIDWLNYNKFIIIQLSEYDINICYRNKFGEQKLKYKQEQKQSIHTLLNEILLTVKIWERTNLLSTLFGIKEFKSFDTKEISKLIDFQIPNTGYKHIDINTGLKFIEDYEN